MKRPLFCRFAALWMTGGSLVAAPVFAQPTITYLHENAAWVPDDAREGEGFGRSLAAGDFNDDGLPDLVIGVPYAQSSNLVGTGAVHVMLSRLGTGPFPFGQYWDQFLACAEPVEVNDFFGGALAVGDFDGDGVDDLAIGAPGDDVGESSNSGLVIVLFGRAGLGVSQGRCQKWHQDRPGVADAAEDGDNFGASLAAGDFNGDGIDDLAVGVPGEGLSGALFAGAVQVFPGQWGVGLVTPGAPWLHEGRSLGGYLLGGTPAEGHHFGSALASGDFNQDGVDDLAIGIPEESVAQGAVQVLMGAFASGLTGRDGRFLEQGSASLPDAAEHADAFGQALAVGDFNDDGFGDLAIGVPCESFGTFNCSGAFHVVNGSLSGLRGRGAFFTLETLQESPGGWDSFGGNLAAGDFNGDGMADLAVSAPAKSVAAARHAGAVFLLNGSSSGLTPTSRLWHQDLAGIGGVASSYSRFGLGLAAADFDGDGAADLAIGAPYDDPGILNAGSVNVLMNLDSPPPPPLSK